MAKTIQLSHDKRTLVDDADFERLNQWNWYAHKDKHGKWYAHRFEINKTILMHRVITSAPSGKQVDHKDGDGLNNTRNNLRICTQAQNTQNKGKPKDNTTGFKGVVRNRNKFQAQIGIDGNNIYLGIYNTPEEAARAYDAAAKRLHGEFANLNFEAVTS